MSDSKVYMFPETGTSTNSLISSLVPLLTQRGVDPNVLLAMNNRNNDGFGEGGWFIWILFLLFFGGWGNGFGNGFGGFNNGFGANALGTGYLSNQLNNDLGRDLLMQSIQGNGNAINQLATTLNCSIGDIQTAINGVMAQVQNVGNQIGMNSMQVINAIQAGNCQIGSQLAQCCCSIEKSILESNYLTERGFCNTNQILAKGFSDLGYADAQQTCELKQVSNANTASIIAKLDAIEDSRKDRELAEKDRMIATLTARSERQAELQPIYSALSEIQCNQPPVKKIACPETYVPVNNAINATYGLIPTYGYGFNNWAWNGCSCNNSLWG